MNIRQLYRPSSAKPMLLTLAATFALALCGSVQAQNSKMKPVAVVAFNSVSHLLEDANFVGSLGDQPRLADSVRPFVGMLQGLDNEKPIGLIVQSDGINPSGAICIPVTDVEMLLGGLGMFGVTSEDGPNGTKQIGVNGQTLFVRAANGWAFVSMMPQMLDNLPEDPSKLFSTLTKDYDIGVRVHVQNIPEAYTQMALGQVQSGMEAGMRKSDQESDEQFAARQKITKLQVEQIKQAVEDLDQLTFGIGVDSEQQRTYFDLGYTAIAGSKLADSIALNSDPKTNFAGFFQPDAAMMMSMASKIGKTDIAQFEQVYDTMLKQIGNGIENEAEDLSDKNRQIVKSAFGDFMAAFKATFQAGKMDAGAVLNVSPSSLSLVAGGYIADPSKVESGLKKLEGVIQEKEPKFSGIDWNSSSHADVKFHTFSVPIDEDDQDAKQAKQLFGDTIDVAIGIGKETVYFSLGRDCVKAIKNIMDASAASPQKSVPPMEMTLALAQIMETAEALADEKDKTQIRMMTNMLANETNGRDHLRVVVQPVSNGVRIRFEAEEGVLRAIGMAVMAAQMQAVEAGAGF